MVRPKDKMSTEIFTQTVSSTTVRWLLRFLVPLGGHRGFLLEGGFGRDGLAQVLGLLPEVEVQVSEEAKFNRVAELARLRQLHQEVEAQVIEPETDGYLARNIERLRELVGLSDVDCQILAFMVRLNGERVLDDAADCLGFLNTSKALHALAVLLDLTEQQVREALRDSAPLAQSGLLRLDRSSQYQFSNRFDLLSYGFADHMMCADTDPLALLRDTIQASAPAQLSLTDYPHIEQPMILLKQYLHTALAQRRRGVNIFLYGRPGTGKTQLVKALAAEMATPLFEIAHEDEDGDPILGERRLRALNAGQRFFARQSVLMVFDEVEDVFNDADQNGKSTAQKRKAWMNRTLEDNVVPTIWVSNDVDCLDAAFIRRFDMMFEVPIPPKSQRARLIAQSCEGLIDAVHIERMSEMSALAPAVITRAASVVQSISHALSTEQMPRALDLLVNNTLQAQGHNTLPKRKVLSDVYDPAFINGDCDILLLVDGLRAHPDARICLYGPPGTGKTALGHWLASELDKPLLLKRCSDLLSMYIGQAEKNIAAAFAEAEQEGAVLLIDEVDSFLQDRRGAQRSWEVTEVNEMLTQMEAFNGIFIASTNLMTTLDPAAMRRFDLKVKFDFLTASQAWRLFDRYVQQVLGRAALAEFESVVAGLRALTPGDFAAVLRRSRFSPIVDEASFIKALRAECDLKENTTQSIGFVV